MTLLTNFTQNEKNDETTEQPITFAHCPVLATWVSKGKKATRTTPYSERVKSKNNFTN